MSCKFLINHSIVRYHCSSLDYNVPLSRRPLIRWQESSGRHKRGRRRESPRHSKVEWTGRSHHGCGAVAAASIFICRWWCGVPHYYIHGCLPRTRRGIRIDLRHVLDPFGGLRTNFVDITITVILCDEEGYDKADDEDGREDDEDPRCTSR